MGLLVGKERRSEGWIGWVVIGKWICKLPCGLLGWLGGWLNEYYCVAVGLAGEGSIHQSDKKGRKGRPAGRRQQ